MYLYYCLSNPGMLWTPIKPCLFSTVFITRDSNNSTTKIYQTQRLTCSVPRQDQILEQPSLSSENLPEHKDLPAVHQDRTRSWNSHHSLVKVYQTQRLTCSVPRQDQIILMNFEGMLPWPGPNFSTSLFSKKD